VIESAGISEACSGTENGKDGSKVMAHNQFSREVIDAAVARLKAARAG
jgi:hypothetical protein